MAHHEPALTALSRSECLALLRTAVVGRVVFTERALPAVMPVSYAVLDEDVVIATEPGSRLETAARHGVLAFEVDDIDTATRTGWSVVLTGLPTLLDDPHSRARAAAVLDPWWAERRDVLISIPSTVLTGRRITAGPAVPLRQVTG